MEKDIVGGQSVEGGGLSDERIVAWAAALEDYARDWDETFDNRPDYFTQEFWYLLVGCLSAHMQNRPMTVSAACQIMKTGSSRTREERLKRAVDDGFLMKERASQDRRETIVRPTPKLEQAMRAHFARTYTLVKSALAE